MTKKLMAKLYLVFVAVGIAVVGILIPDLGTLIALFFGIGFLVVSVVIVLATLVE